jgi:hypothetical protein
MHACNRDVLDSVHRDDGDHQLSELPTLRVDQCPVGMEVKGAWRSQGPAEQLSKFGMRTSPASAGATRTGTETHSDIVSCSFIERGKCQSEGLCSRILRTLSIYSLSGFGSRPPVESCQAE